MPIRRILPTLIAALTPLAAVAQARPALSAESLEIALGRELDAALAPLQEGNPAAARRRLDRFLDANTAVGLGQFGYARALQLCLAGEPEQAAAALDLHFATHPAPPPAPHSMWVGQIYLNALREHLSLRDTDGRLIQRLALRALDLQQPPEAVASVVGTALEAPLAPATADAIRLALTQRIENDPKLAPPERQRALVALRGGGASLDTPPAQTPLTLSLHRPDGKRIELASLRGRVVLLHFWARWCPVTATEAPFLVRAYERFHTRGFESIGIAAEDDGQVAPVRAAAARLGFTWDQVLDGDDLGGPLALRFGVETLPHAILLDRRGVPRFSGVALRGEALGPAIETLLDEALPPPSSPRRERDRDQDAR